jgi:hypothetical protein
LEGEYVPFEELWWADKDPAVQLAELRATGLGNKRVLKENADIELNAMCQSSWLPALTEWEIGNREKYFEEHNKKHLVELKDDPFAAIAIGQAIDSGFGRGCTSELPVMPTFCKGGTVRLWFAEGRFILVHSYTVDGRKSFPYTGPLKGLIRTIRLCFAIYIYIYITCLVPKLRFLVFLEVLQGFWRSGRLVGTISTYPGTSPTLWSRVMVKNHLGETVSSAYGMYICAYIYMYVYVLEDGG